MDSVERVETVAWLWVVPRGLRVLKISRRTLIRREDIRKGPSQLNRQKPDHAKVDSGMQPGTASFRPRGAM